MKILAIRFKKMFRFHHDAKISGIQLFENNSLLSNVIIDLVNDDGVILLSDKSELNNYTQTPEFPIIFAKNDESIFFRDTTIYIKNLSATEMKTAIKINVDNEFYKITPVDSGMFDLIRIRNEYIAAS